MDEKERKVILVTGSTGGIGEGIVHRMVSEGAIAIVTGRRKEHGEKVVSDLNRHRVNAQFIQADISRESDCGHLISETIHRFGRLDALINNAAIFPHIPFENMTAEQWDMVFTVNVRAPFLLSRLVIPHMSAQHGGSIINIGSTLAYRTPIERLAYGCSKGALVTMTRALARELTADRIRVNWITVGWVATEGEIALRNNLVGDGFAYLEEQGRNASMGRLETIEEIAAGVSYLLSDEAMHITGCELNISGGLWV